MREGRVLGAPGRRLGHVTSVGDRAGLEEARTVCRAGEAEKVEMGGGREVRV